MQTYAALSTQYSGSTDLRPEEPRPGSRIRPGTQVPSSTSAFVFLMSTTGTAAPAPLSKVPARSNVRLHRACVAAEPKALAVP